MTKKGRAPTVGNPGAAPAKRGIRIRFQLPILMHSASVSARNYALLNNSPKNLHFQIKFVFSEKYELRYYLCWRKSEPLEKLWQS